MITYIACYRVCARFLVSLNCLALAVVSGWSITEVGFVAKKELANTGYYSERWIDFRKE